MDHYHAFWQASYHLLVCPPSGQPWAIGPFLKADGGAGFVPIPAHAVVTGMVVSV